jgi:hypothetical protein
MWIDTEKLRFDDYHPHMFSEDELMPPEEQAEFERTMAE